jgi:hypothetical protein
MGDRRLDRPAMGGDDDVAAAMPGVDALDRRAHPLEQIDEALAARRPLLGRSEPVTADVRGAAGEEFGAVAPLPFAEILLREGALLMQRIGRSQAGGPDRLGGLMGALEVARIPHRVLRQDARDRGEHHLVAAVAVEVLLAVDMAAVLAHGRVAHPPPAGDLDARGSMRNARGRARQRSRHDQIGLPV